MTLEDFLEAYEIATNSHDFDKVSPLIATEAQYFFSDATLIGREAIRAAFEKTWATIQNETYGLTDILWLARTNSLGVCTYKFHWRGIVGGEPKEGFGRGTNIMMQKDGNWQMVHEHLSRDPYGES